MEKYQTLKKKLEEVGTNWEREHNQLDANWVCVKFPKNDWKIAKSLGLEKDYHHGWILYAKSVNSNGTDFSLVVDGLVRESGLPLLVRERQL